MVVHVLDVLLTLGLHFGLQLGVGGVLVGDGGHCMCGSGYVFTVVVGSVEKVWQRDWKLFKADVGL